MSYPKKVRPETDCPTCGNRFTVVWKNQRFCSKKCVRTDKKRPEKDCLTCGKHFICVKPEQRFCSKKCIRWGTKHLVCPCGVNTSSYTKKYCSPEHHELYRKRKPSVKIVEHVCLTCGEAFERPHFYPGKKMFCSVKCSNEQHSSKRRRHYQYGDLNIIGSYELRFIACLERLDLDWSPWPDNRPFVHSGHEYRPDFLVDGLAVEVKGAETEDHPQRAMRAAWDCPEPLIFIDRERLSACEHVFSQGKLRGYLYGLVKNRETL